MTDNKGREIKDLKDLKFDKKNYRTHGEENQRLIKKSITEAGLGRSIVVDAENEIIGGNGLVSQLPPNTPVKVIETTGDELVVVKRTDLKPDDEKRKKLALLDNSTGNQVTWNFETLMDDFALDELPDLGVTTDMLQDADPGKNPEDLEEPTAPPIEAVETRVKPGDIWRLGNHFLICGDCTASDSMARLFDAAGIEQADLVITDPPYNVAYVGKQESEMTIQNDDMDAAAFTQFLKAGFNNYFSYVKPGGAYYIFFASRTTPEFYGALIECGLRPRQELVWVKNNAVLSRSDYHWKHEPILYGWKPGASHYFVDEFTHTTVQKLFADKAPEEMTKAELVEIFQKYIIPAPTSTIFDHKPNRSDYHPTMKPVSLLGKLMRNSSLPGQAVLDPFLGSGSTMLAAEQLGRRCLGVELDPRYCDVILMRWEELTGKEAAKCQE